VRGTNQNREAISTSARFRLLWLLHPNTSVAVDVYYDDELIASGVEASEYRPDLSPYTKDGGCHAFDYKLPRHVRDGRPHRVSVKISGTGINAYGSPKIFMGLPKGPEAKE